MTANIAPIRMGVNIGEIINETIDIEGLLKGTELANGTPTVTESRGLTITNEAVNTTTQVVQGRDVLVGEGIDYTISGFSSGLYVVDITFDTDASATRVCRVEYQVCG